jgi:hypothetical protein
LHRKLTFIGLGQDVNNQKKELGEMALRAGQSFKMNGVTVKEGDITNQQEKWWWEENIGKPVDEISHKQLNPEQKLYLCLAAGDFDLEEARTIAREHGIGTRNSSWRKATEQQTASGQVTAFTRPSFVGADFVTKARIKELLEAAVANSPKCLYGAKLFSAKLKDAYLKGADLRDTDLRKADLRGAKLKEADLRGADLEGAHLWGADLEGADLRITNLSGADFERAKNLNTVQWDLAFYDATNPPKNLPANIKDKLLALDEKSYTEAEKLQNAYREALVSDNEEDITAAEKALTDYLKEKAREAAGKALHNVIPVLGEEAISIVVEISAGSAVRVTGELATTAASPSDVSLGGDVNHYSQYGYGSR